VSEPIPASKPAKTQPRKRSRWGRRLLFVIILGLVGGFALTRYEMPQVAQQMAQNVPPQSVFQASLVQAYPTIAQATRQIASKTPGGGSTNQLVSAAATDGFRRLDDAWLAKLVWLSAELANRADTQTCAMLWSGGEGAAIVPAIEQLPVDQQRKWARIFDRAALASVNNLPLRPAPSAAEFQAALSRTMLTATPDGLSAIKTMIDDPQHQSDAAKCAAVRAIYAGMMRANYADAITVERGLINQ
jgi:hypothetical protein